MCFDPEMCGWCVCLHVTASPSWTPGEEELEQAALAVSLLARLPGALRSNDALLPGSDAAAATAVAGSLSGLRDDMWLLWQALAGHDRDGQQASGILVSSVLTWHSEVVLAGLHAAVQVLLWCMMYLQLW